jgi:stage II sporulation protein D
LGMSQWGARNLANQGVNYQQILSHYYPNAILSQLQ